jgi:DNA-binding transcriptional ArsR family regulator
VKSGDVFKALGDESRRFLLDQLRETDGLTLGELCTELNMSRQAVSKHLAILERANLVSTVVKGRSKHHYLNPIPLQEIVDRWVQPYRQMEARALTRLKCELEGANERDE